MNELLKAKYYKLINDKDFEHYEIVGKLLAEIEDKLIHSHNSVPKEDLIDIASLIKESEGTVYNELINDINSGLIYGGSSNG
jgi:hypothetical protein